MEEYHVFNTLKEADDYANKHTDAHMSGEPFVITPELHQALKSGKTIMLGINGWEYATAIQLRRDPTNCPKCGIGAIQNPYGDTWQCMICHHKWEI